MENNKLIVEFMGVKFDKGTLYNMGYDVFSNGNLYRSHELKYHKSWDWLMPVINKCLEGEAEQSKEISNITIKNIYEGICNQEISFTYDSVVEFINKKE